MRICTFAVAACATLLLSASCSDQRNPIAPSPARQTGAASFDIALSPANAPSDAPASPANLSFTVNGNTVVLQWSPSPGALNSYLIEAGSAAGLSDIVQFNTGSTATSFTATNVPPGQYHVRVRALTATGATDASNEVVVVIAGPTCPPAAPTGFAALRETCGLALMWNGVPGAIAYIIEAGNAPGLANIVSFDTGNPATTLRTRYPAPGRYYVRARARATCGASAVSNELVLDFIMQPNPIHCESGQAILW